MSPISKSDTRPRAQGAVGILPPRARTWKRGEREKEDPREWDSTYRCDQWMKCGQTCGCQAGKASGKSRPGVCRSFSAGSSGGDHPVAVDLPSGVSAPECKGAEKKRESQAIRQEKGNLLEEKERVIGP